MIFEEPPKDDVQYKLFEEAPSITSLDSGRLKFGGTLHIILPNLVGLQSYVVKNAYHCHYQSSFHDIVLWMELNLEYIPINFIFQIRIIIIISFQ